MAKRPEWVELPANAKRIGTSHLPAIGDVTYYAALRIGGTTKAPVMVADCFRMRAGVVVRVPSMTEDMAELMGRVA